MVADATDACEHASDDMLVAWAESNTLMSLFAQKELVYRDQKRTIAKYEAEARD